ncbi:MAG: hypothetical protein QHH17_04265 [Candidatus Bathyarchaeota archaeon]|nr:hypothetical protein [Candidatus Bathyarchaeota archaeon]
MSQRKLTQNETQLLKEVLSADYKNGNIRLREGEYQYNLAKTIASFHLELHFPDVKDIIKRLYGEEKANDIQFIRMIQTILKKMEKSNVVKILPKKNPWDLQRYMLLSFKFRDSEKNLVEFATDEEIKQTQNLLQSIINQQEPLSPQPIDTKIKISALTLIIIISYITILWTLTQSIINPIVFVPALSVAVACAVILGKTLSRE